MGLWDVFLRKPGFPLVSTRDSLSLGLLSQSQPRGAPKRNFPHMLAFQE